MPDERRVLFGSLAYGLWIARNKYYFEDKNIPLEIEICMAISATQSYKNAFLLDQMTCQRTPAQPIRRAWYPPQEGHIKMNSDAAQLDDNIWGFRVVFHDGRGNILATTTKSINQSLEPRLAKVQSLKWGLQLALKLCFHDVEAKSNCLEVIQTLHQNCV